MIHLLIERGADVNALDAHGNNALEYALTPPLSDSPVISHVVQVLLEAGTVPQGTDLLLFAAGDEELTAQLLDAGAKVRREELCRLSASQWCFADAVSAAVVCGHSSHEQRSHFGVDAAVAPHERRLDIVCVRAIGVAIAPPQLGSHGAR